MISPSIMSSPLAPAAGATAPGGVWDRIVSVPASGGRVSVESSVQRPMRRISNIGDQATFFNRNGVLRRNIRLTALVQPVPWLALRLLRTGPSAVHAGTPRPAAGGQGAHGPHLLAGEPEQAAPLPGLTGR